MTDPIPNPLEPTQLLKRPLQGEQLEEAHPPQPIFPEDSAVTKAEKIERNGNSEDRAPTSKRIRLDAEPKPIANVKVEESASNGNKTEAGSESKTDSRDKIRGIAMIKAEYACLSDVFYFLIFANSPKDI